MLINAIVVEIKKNGVEVVIPSLERRFIEADTMVFSCWTHSKTRSRAS